MGCECSCCSSCCSCCPPGQQVMCMNGKSYVSQSGSCCGSSCGSSCGTSCGSSCGTSCGSSCGTSCGSSCMPYSSSCSSQPAYKLVYFRPMQYGYGCVPCSTMGSYGPMMASVGCYYPKKNCC